MIKLPNDIVYIFKIGWLTLFLIPFFGILIIDPTILLDYKLVFSAYQYTFELFGLQCIVLWLALFLIMPFINQLNESIRYKKFRLNWVIILVIGISQLIDSMTSISFFNTSFIVALIGIFIVSLLIWLIKLEPNKEQKKLDDFDHLIE